MPTRVQLPDGSIGEFPDGMSEKDIEAVLQKQFPAQSQPEARTVGNYLSEAARGVGRGIKNDVVGLKDLALHPGEVGQSMRDQAIRDYILTNQNIKDTQGQPIGRRAVAGALTALENAPMIGDVVKRAEQGGTTPGSPEALGAAAEAATTLEAPKAIAKLPEIIRTAPEAARTAVDAVTGTGPRATRDLVKDTKVANAAGEAKAGASQAVENQRTGLQKKINETSEELRGRIETARENAKKIGNEKYNAVNEKLNEVPANQGAIIDGLVNAGEKIKGSQVKGSEANPRILQDVEDRIQRGDEFTYEDLQGYYSELNSELIKGTLPGDVYAAYDALHDAIGNEMQRIADEHGAGEQLSDARNYWRRMKQTFGKPYAPRDAASKTLSSLSPEFVKEETLKNRLRLLGHYDPEIERAAGEVTDARNKLKSLPKAKPADFTPKKIGAEDIQNAKLKSLQERTKRIRARGQWIASGAAGYRALSALLQGHLAAVPPDLLEGAIAVGGVEGIARLLERPGVQEFLTNPTPKDLAEVPPELRGDLQQVIDIAKKKGIRVSPKLVRAVQGAAVAGAAGNPKKRVAAALSPAG